MQWIVPLPLRVRVQEEVEELREKMIEELQAKTEKGPHATHTAQTGTTWHGM